MIYCALMALSKKPRMSTAIRFPADLHATLKREARKRDVSINFLVVLACREFVAKLIPADKVKWTR